MSVSWLLVLPAVTRRRAAPPRGVTHSISREYDMRSIHVLPAVLLVAACTPPSDGPGDSGPDSTAAVPAADAASGRGLTQGGGAAASQLGRWRIVDGRSAPWDTSRNVRRFNPGLAGTDVEMAATRVVAHAPLGCDDAAYEFVVTAAEGLFQGSLPAPAATTARRLGMLRVPALTLRVRCDAGVFDYHHQPGDTLLAGLDGVVWKLAPDTPASTPAAAVRRLLAEHMMGDMGFTPATVRPKQDLLSAALSGDIDHYFAQPQPADEPPLINGDPFTDSQEHPDRFTLAVTAAGGVHAVVRVVFDDAGRSRPADFHLIRQATRWLLDDIRYEDGSTFRDLLRGQESRRD